MCDDVILDQNLNVWERFGGMSSHVGCVCVPCSIELPPNDLS
jgi:hypothetical protein